MAIQSLARHSMLVAGGVAVIAMTAGCSLNATGSLVPAPPTPSASVQAGAGFVGTGGSPASSPALSPAPNPGASSSGSAPVSVPQPAAPTPRTNPTPECKASNLRLSLGGGDGAGAGSDYPSLEFTNISGTTCLIGGFPGVSYVSGNNGQQVGAPAVRSGSAKGVVTLAPGQMASALLKEANALNYPSNECDPVSVRGFRVYAPGDTAAMFISSPGTACSSTSMPGGPELSVQSIVAGSGNQPGVPG